MAPTGVAAFQYGTGEKSCLNQPRGLHLDEAGNLYVADFGNFCVVRFSLDDAAAKGGAVVVGVRGKQLMDIDYLKDIDKPLAPAEGEGVLLKNPIDVALSSDGALLVLDCPMGRVQRFDRGQQTSLATVVVPPPRSMPAKSLAVPEAIKHPRCMLQLSDESLVICDTWSHRVLKYSKDAMAPELLAGTPNSCGPSERQLNFPSCVAFDAEGGLLVSDTNNHRIQRFLPGDLTGATVAGSSSGTSGDGLSELCMPTGLAIEVDGSLLVADRGNGRVLRFKPGETTGELVLGKELMERPWGVAVDKDGGIFVSDERRGIVLRLLPSGATAPANAQPATAPSKRAPAPAPTPAPTSMTFQPPARSNGTTAVAPKAAVAKATPEVAPKTAVFQPPERVPNRATAVPQGEPPKLPKAATEPEPQAKVTTTSSHVAKDPLGLDDLD